MKKNNKGFMLVEIIVVTVVVVAVMTSLYVLFNRVYNSFEKKSTYSDVDAIYALDLIRDYLIETEVVYNDNSRSFLYNDLLLGVSYSSGNSNGYIELSCDLDNMLNQIVDSGGISYLSSTFNEDYCNNLFDEYNIGRIFLVGKYASSESNALENLYNRDDLNISFKEYIDYLRNSFAPYNDDELPTDCSYDSILIIETYSEEDSVNKNISNKYACLNNENYGCIN